MKKIICLVLCVVAMCFTLVGCSDDVYGDIIENLDEINQIWTPEVVEEMEFDLYVVFDDSFVDGAVAKAVEEARAEKEQDGSVLTEAEIAELKAAARADILEKVNGAQTTVESRINKYLENYKQDQRKFDLQKTTLDIHYLTADEYEAKMLAAADPSIANDDDRADIVLIIGEQMFNTLYSEKRIACLDDILTAAPPYGTLYGQVAESLFATSKVAVTDKVSSVYCVPNDHIVGEYRYAVVNKTVADALYMGTDSVRAMVSEDSEMTVEFMNRLNNAIDRADPAFVSRVEGIDLDKAVQFVSGTYADAYTYAEAGNYVVLVSTPVALKADAYTGAFAIVRHPLDNMAITGEEPSKQAKEKISTYYNRCMEVIFELNTSVELHNLLQYGAANIHYDIVEQDDDGNILSVKYRDDGFYRMNLLYTGDINTSYFNEELGWTEFVSEYGAEQNKCEKPDVVLNYDSFGVVAE
ncbi:MAG: hypothetical protein IJX38_03950 [Clostridia bacterium]|nr:hypothetical protein [Clostridia bacterium]